MEEITNLTELGLSSKAAAAYVALLRLQKANAAQIAKEAQIERTTIYKVLDELVKKELISKSVSGKRISFVAESPTQLQQLWQKQGGLLESLLPTLTAIQGKKGVKPRVRFYENLEGIRKALNESLNAQEKLRRDFASVESIVDFLGKRFITQHIDKRVEKGIKVKSLRSASKVSRIGEQEWYLKQSNKDVLRETRYLDKSVEFEPLIIIYDNTVLIISSSKESYALVIDSPELAQAMKVLFDVAWTTAKK